MRRGGTVIAAGIGFLIIGMAAGVLGMQARGAATQAGPPTSSYLPVKEEDFRTVFQRMTAAKAQVMKRQMDLLNVRYDLADRPAAGVTMSREKPIQEGVRVCFAILNPSLRDDPAYGIVSPQERTVPC